jgi:hypothetical protein
MLVDASLGRFRPYLLAILTSFIIGLFSLSRAYSIPVYMVFGVSTAYLLIVREGESPILRVNARFARELVGISVVCVAILFIFVAATVRWH